MANKNMAMCGLDCASCPAFIATKNNDNELRIKTAKEWTKNFMDQNEPPIKPEDINCLGCLSLVGSLYSNCSKCEVRKCALAKSITNCKDCKDYKCDKLTELQKHLF